ncbi:alpha/beta hydrolase [Ketogulonicigenium vulgare]|uniref:alpha/beta hydrolase n=1 Tax=Ketogulonicigenium vulgare TaxID=92945 RepID=UPI0001E67D27|nr:alpha/beta fold hydrolase [Ketogulonicigenium vulgare]ADO42777.1 phospholipase/carboxylesterase family protein [Ketogulonicigenium vulgare Y25]ALJ81114.1 phospholipase [Ketogulonicigenium vulgare]ANW33864.1 phospholipase [Ketogulonicigenium vulgare]AOZ54688.1 phospholipase/carboxylesterase family protein [Ketogulonicigenium vulgare]
MTRALNALRQEPASGETRSAVIFLHGFGANGEDLISLANLLADHMPDTLFISPDAPEECAGRPGGFQWFPIPWVDGASQEEVEESVTHSLADLQAFIDGVMVDEDLLPEQVVLFGFSQGAMMALQAAPRREEAIAGVVAIAGRMLRPTTLAEEAEVYPATLLIHGDQDNVVPPENMPTAVQVMQEAGFKEIFAHIQKGAGHTIAQDGLQVALAFMRDRLGYA